MKGTIPFNVVTHFVISYRVETTKLAAPFAPQDHHVQQEELLVDGR